MSRSVQITQTILAAIAISLVLALFIGNLVGGQSRDVPASPSTVGPQTPKPLNDGERMPGIPEKPIGEYETFPARPNQDADRQLGYTAKGTPRVDFLESLGGYEAYAAQVVDWQPCASSEHPASQCAKVRVPLDWDKPEGDSIEIALRRVPDGDSSRGPLFVNPGGPGFGGQSYAEAMAGRWKNFDLIGWDPRGTGESTHVVCGSLKQTDAVMDLDGSPDDAAEDKALRDGAAAFAQQCRDGSGRLLDHITTIDVVRDLDLLRHLVGAEKLNYVGVSYGTYVGSTYATLFPHSVGRLVLDGAVDITGKDEVPQVKGFELALDNFATWCSTSDLCDLDGSKEEIDEQIGTFLQGLDATPLRVGGRTLTQTLAATGVAYFLYSDEEAYRTLSLVLAGAMAGDGEGLLLAADAMNGRRDNGYETIAYAFPAMACADSVDEGVAPVLDDWKKTFAVAPILAPNMGTSYSCQLWTARSAPQVKLTGAGAPPILVVGTTGDSATPYEQAVSMAHQLESGTLLTFKGAGHGAVSGTNSCVRDAVDRYLNDGVVPKEGATCS